MTSLIGDLECSQSVVVDLGQIEVHPAPTIAADLGAGHERAGELVEHECVEHVAHRVEGGDRKSMGGVDGDAGRLPSGVAKSSSSTCHHVSPSTSMRVTCASPPDHSIVPMSLT